MLTFTQRLFLTSWYYTSNTEKKGAYEIHIPTSKHERI